MDRKLWAEARAIAARHDPSRGEDLAQDLAVTMLESGAAPRHAPAWLERVARNAAIDRWRVESRRAELLPQDERGGVGRRPRDEPDLPRAAAAGSARRWPGCRGRSAGPRWRDFTPTCRTTRRPRARASRPPPRGRAFIGRWRRCGRGWPCCVRCSSFPAFRPARWGWPSSRPGSAGAAGAGGGDRGGDGWSRGSDAALRARAGDGRGGHAARTEETRARPGVGRRGRQAPPVQELSFDNDTVEGDLAGPDSFFVRGLPEIDQPSLIELRRHFIPEMLETLEDL